MGKIRNLWLPVLCTLILTTGVITAGRKCNQAYGKDKETHLTNRSTPTQSLMRIISSHTAKMLDAIMIGDFTAVIKESHEIIGASEVGMQMFFPEKGKVGEWFVNAGNDPNDASAVAAMKEEFQKYLQLVIDASRKVAETSEKKNIIATYNSFDSMLRNACFACHVKSRLEWPRWMKQVEAE